MLKRATSVTYDVVDGQAVVIDAEGRELITLNPVGTMIWVALDGMVTEQDLVEALSERFPEVSRDRLASDVGAFLAELRELKLVEETE